MAATLAAVASGALAGHQIMLVRGTIWGLGLMAVMLPVGCGPRTRVTLLQPEPGRPARELHLAGDWATFDPAEGLDRLLLSWPLPGAHGGRRVFELYLRLPQANGTYSAKAADGENPGVTGL
ncbi:MAG: hypothetical protein JXB13_00320, partial [Phycisphaerae bacterium]|nr:hypothetical protein [Phycisphaerae bacterium]